MLFAVSGSQGSGKSTVIQRLKELDYKVIERKTSRSILDDWGVTLSEVNNNRELTVKFQMEILARKMQDEKHAVTSNEIWFTERSYLDLFVYALIAIGKDNEYSQWITHYYNSCKAAQKSYREIYYIPGGQFNVEYDGVRGVNPLYADMVDSLIERHLIKCDPTRYKPINIADIDQRVAIIEENVRYYLANVADEIIGE